MFLVSYGAMALASEMALADCKFAAAGLCGGSVMTRRRQIRILYESEEEPCGATMESVACIILL